MLTVSEDLKSAANNVDVHRCVQVDVALNTGSVLASFQQLVALVLQLCRLLSTLLPLGQAL